MQKSSRKTKVKVQIARFPYLGNESPDVTDWMVRTVRQMDKDPRIELLPPIVIGDTPIDMVRNLTVEVAKASGADLLIMVDNDMKPDLPELGAKPFWETSFDFWWQDQHPCLIAAPYCGPPPHCNVFIFRWANLANDEDIGPDAHLKLDQFTREEAAGRTGFEEVAALPTGLMIIDMEIFKKLQKPYFYYEWKNEGLSCDKCRQRTPGPRCQKDSTEDVTFTRDVSLIAGFPIYVNWDAWAGHWKRVCVTKPKMIYTEQINEKFRQAVLNDQRIDERVMMVEPHPNLQG